MSMDKYLAVSFLLSISSFCFGHGNDDPLLWSSNFHEIEFSENDYLKIDNDSWIGRDLKKLWIKAEVERYRGETESAELQVLYKQAIAANWNVQAGYRRDFEPQPKHSWAVIGVEGLAPYYIEIDTAFYLGDKGRLAFRFEAEYEMLITQKITLTPRLEFNVFAQNEESTNSGSGLSNTEIDLRLRYHIKREFAPYIGVSWNSYHGNTADFLRTKNEKINESGWLIGFEFWI